MTRLLLLLPIALLASCAGPTCWTGGIDLRPVEEKARKAVVADFGDPSNAVVYRGLAHPQANASLYRRQVQAGGWKEIKDFKFFSEPLNVSQETVRKVLRLYSHPRAHQAWGPKETCDGFHPDYVIVWSSEGEERVLQLCYGCHEWKFFGPNGMLLTDISERAYFGALTETWLPKEDG